MDFQDAHKLLSRSLNEVVIKFQRVPGSAMLIRYVQSSYQNDPVRSAIELVLVVFFIRYLLAPSYSTHRQNFVTLSEEVWSPQRKGERCTADLDADGWNRRLMTSSTSGPLSRWLRPRPPLRKLTMRSFR